MINRSKMRYILGMYIALGIADVDFLLTYPMEHCLDDEQRRRQLSFPSITCLLAKHEGMMCAKKKAEQTIFRAMGKV
jgi:hypothetical protein